MSTPPPFRSVVLVGFMGSGKTTVGRRLAGLLDWTFVDVDDLLETRFGLPVEAIFQRHGEERFREAEEELAREALRAPGRVVAPGGGWGAVPGRLENLDADVLTVWLQVSPEAAVERARADRRARPLLDVSDPVGRARSLLEVRRPSYRQARLHLDGGEASPERLALDIVEYLDTRSSDPHHPDRTKTRARRTGAP